MRLIRYSKRADFKRSFLQFFTHSSQRNMMKSEFKQNKLNNFTKNKRAKAVVNILFKEETTRLITKVIVNA